MGTVDFDYVVAGGGLAGCILAARLSEDPKVEVLLVEAGGSPDSIWIRMPAGMGRLFTNPAYNWGFTAHSATDNGSRELYLPQGKVLGGSSSINGMAFVRGHPQDYDRWEALGAEGWNWQSVLPYFIELEQRLSPAGELRGTKGPLGISEPTFRHPSSKAFVEAAVRAGLPRNPDYNGVSQEGASFLQYSIRNGKRDSAFRAWLEPALRRPNLLVETNAFVHRVLLEGRRAVGIRYVCDGRLCKVRARREVIVTGGAIGSPRILLHSGIGPAAELERAVVPVTLDLPGVGRNLIDHPYLQPTFTTRLQNQSLNRHLRGWRVFAHGASWLLGGRNPDHRSLASRSLRAPLGPGSPGTATQLPSDQFPVRCTEDEPRSRGPRHRRRLHPAAPVTRLGEDRLRNSRRRARYSRCLPGTPGGRCRNGRKH